MEYESKSGKPSQVVSGGQGRSLLEQNMEIAAAMPERSPVVSVGQPDVTQQTLRKSDGTPLMGSRGRIRITGN